MKKIENYPQKIEANKVYSYVIKGGYDVGMEFKFLGSNELTKEGLETLYEKAIIHMKKKENFIQQITFFGIDDKGNFYEKREIKGNGYFPQKFSKDFFKGIEDLKFISSNNGKVELFQAKERIEIIIDTLDRNYNLGIKKLYNDLKKENSINNFMPIRKKILNKKDRGLER